MYTYFLSDIHMGMNSKENWYQQYVHQRLLKSALTYIQNKGKAVDDVIMLGDWFDTWEYCKDGPLPGFDSKAAAKQIVNDNVEVFSPQEDGDFITCLNAIGGNMWYINGNHDMTIKCEDLNDILNLSGKKICSPDNNLVYISEDNLIYAEHGHQYSLTCNNDNHDCNKIAPIPLGYFVSRTGGSYCLDELQKSGAKSAAELPNSGIPSMGDLWSNIKRDCLERENGGLTFANIFLSAVIGKLGGSSASDYKFKMPNGTILTGSDAADMYSWIPMSSILDPGFFEADVDNNLDIFAQRCSNQKYKLVVFGHTHVPKIIYTNLGAAGSGLYANTGFLCSDIPGMEDSSGNGRYMTFCEVEHQSKSLTVRIMKVDYVTGTVSQLSNMSQTIDI